MVGRFAGWLINFPALPNWVSIFQNSTGSSSTTSFKLQDCTFPVAWFSYTENVHHAQFGNSVSGSPLEVPFGRLFFLKYTLLPVLKEGGVLSRIFCAILRLMQVCVFQDSAFKKLGLPRITGWVPVADVRCKFGSLLNTRKMGSLPWLG